MDEARRLLDALRSVNESLDPNRVLVRICEEGARLLDADFAQVLLGDGDAGLRVAATFGGTAESLGEPVEAGEGLAGRVLEAGEPTRSPRGFAVPLRWDGRPRGALVVAYAGEGSATDERLALLEEFAVLAAAACRNASAHAELALSARTDPLTGCLNRAALHDLLRRELERCRRSGGPVSLAILDLDDFKQVNERYGHLAGDEVLRRVGESLRASVRVYDFVVRHGGDEFAIIAIDARERTAVEVAERALRAIGGALGSLDHSEARTAASAGVAQSEEDDSPDDLLGRADRALLHAKHEGLRGAAVPASALPPLPQGAAESESSSARQSRSTDGS